MDATVRSIVDGGMLIRNPHWTAWRAVTASELAPSQQCGDPKGQDRKAEVMDATVRSIVDDTFLKKGACLFGTHIGRPGEPSPRLSLLLRNNVGIRKDMNGKRTFT
ncbi:hypothetical protein HDU93_005446 [Gonapodya sp. JEL0774]|nr:hypothetical protein HDU93_005446 [Gonapodya sp. JEL0774]